MTSYERPMAEAIPASRFGDAEPTRPDPTQPRVCIIVPSVPHTADVYRSWRKILTGLDERAEGSAIICGPEVGHGAAVDTAPGALLLVVDHTVTRWARPRLAGKLVSGARRGAHRVLGPSRRHTQEAVVPGLQDGQGRPWCGQPAAAPQVVGDLPAVVRAAAEETQRRVETLGVTRVTSSTEQYDKRLSPSGVRMRLVAVTAELSDGDVEVYGGRRPAGDGRGGRFYVLADGHGEYQAHSWTAGRYVPPRRQPAPCPAAEAKHCDHCGSTNAPGGWMSASLGLARDEDCFDAMADAPGAHARWYHR